MRICLLLLPFDDINRVMLPPNAKWRLMPGSSLSEQTQHFTDYEFKKYVLKQDISLSDRVDISVANKTYKTSNYIRFMFISGICLIVAIGSQIL